MQRQQQQVHGRFQKPVAINNSHRLNIQVDGKRE